MNNNESLSARVLKVLASSHIPGTTPVPGFFTLTESPGAREWNLTHRRFPPAAERRGWEGVGGRVGKVQRAS